MLRICRTCKVEFEGDPGSTLCPACVKAQKSSTIRDRTCRRCGRVFPGGPRAWYCPECRAGRQKDQAREAKRRKAAGKTRCIGSTDICTICGKPYTVASGLQRYCPDCIPAAYAEADRQQGRAWYAANGDPDARRDLRQSHTAELLCIVCGKSYKPRDSSVTCSPACATTHRREQGRKFETTHREERNIQHRKRTQARLDAMTLEERESHRQAVNERARINYHKRKKRKED